MEKKEPVTHLYCGKVENGNNAGRNCKRVLGSTKKPDSFVLVYGGLAEKRAQSHAYIAIKQQNCVKNQQKTAASHTTIYYEKIEKEEHAVILIIYDYCDQKKMQNIATHLYCDKVERCKQKDES